jgi:hypothetical protein
MQPYLSLRLRAAARPCALRNAIFLTKGNDMKKFTVALLSLVLLMTTTVWAKTIRVRFPAGRTTVILKGKTTGGPSESGSMDPITYILRASKGQQMTLHLTSTKKNAVFAIYLPRMESLIEDASDGTDWSGTLPKTGDYQIMVFPKDEVTDTTFTLEVTIR